MPDDSPAHPDDFVTPSSEADRAGSPRRPPHPLAVALDRLRRDPGLFRPFLLVGVVLSAFDWLRRQDPIPIVEQGGFDPNALDVQVEFVGYPTGVPRTTLPLESLVDLQYPLLAWGLASYVLPLVAVALAGTITMARAMDGESRRWREAVGPVFGFVVAMDLSHRLLGSIDALQGMGLWGLVPLALYFFVMVRLFAVPGLLVAGRGLWPALRRSNRRIRGRGWTVFGLVLAFGLGAWLLASVSIVGALLSTALVAPVHAVAVVAEINLVDQS